MIQMKRYKAVFWISAVIAVIAGLTGCGSKEPADAVYQTLEDFEGTTIATLTGSLFDQVLDEKFERLSYNHYDDLTTQLEALKKGDVEAVALDGPVAQMASAQRPGEFAVFPEIISADAYNRGSIRVYGNRQEYHEKPCGMGKAAGLKSRAKGTYQKRYFGKVNGSERGKEPAG